MSHHPKVKDSSPVATAGIRKRENGVKSVKNQASSSSIVVEQMPHHPKVKGSSPVATAGIRKRENGVNSVKNQASSSSIVA
jgi:hypothetical protein